MKSTLTPYLQFYRKQWAALCNSMPPNSTKIEISNFKEIDENLSIKEVKEIYLPLSRLLKLHVSNHVYQQCLIAKFLDADTQRRIPYIIGITGSVAVGKSTTARILHELLSYGNKKRTVDLVTTDGFLYPNKILEQKKLMRKKGFPESYDMSNLIRFVLQVKSRLPYITVPIYSHVIYDIIPDKQKIIYQPDILILEGLNVLQNNSNYHDNHYRICVSDFIDFSIYVDAPEQLIKKWYINRFLKFRKNSFSNPNSYFHHYAQLPEKESIAIAKQIWKEINGYNLQQNILPIRERANLILSKNTNHTVEMIQLRK